MKNKVKIPITHGAFSKQTWLYNGLKISCRKRNGFPFYYALISSPQTGATITEIERDGEGGIPSAPKAMELARAEIDREARSGFMCHDCRYEISKCICFEQSRQSIIRRKTKRAKR